MEDRLIHYSKHIHDVYPEVVVVNENLIFRFPRYEGGITHLQREVGILRAIQDRVPVAIPNPTYTSFTPRTVGRVFMGYRLIEGVPLQRETLATLDHTGARSLIAQLAHFLRCLHHVPPKEALPGGSIPRRDGGVRVNPPLRIAR